MTLDQRYFQRVDNKKHNGSLFESYQAVHTRSTMVLFSTKTRTPLAALTLKSTKDIGCLSMLTGRPAPKESAQPHFQGMLSMPDQSFSFVISNLSDEGMINFNVLHTPHRVSEVDPGPAYGINQVNELHANQSYEIEADQRTNKTMVLKGKTKEKYDPITKQNKVVPLTVDESETMQEKTKLGLYFYLSVVPDVANQELVKKYQEGTTWRVAPGFVRKIKPPRILRDAGPVYEERYRSLILNCPFRIGAVAAASSSDAFFSGLTRSSDEPSPVNGDEFYSFMARPPAGGAEAGSHKRKEHSMRYSAPKQGCKKKGSPFGFSMSWMSLRSESGRPVEQSARKSGALKSSSRKSSAHRSNQVEIASAMMDEESDEEMDANGGNAAATPFVADVKVGNTQAGELAYGEDIMVSSGYTGHEYAYEHASEPTVLCMSIWEDMKFLPILDTVEKMLEAEMKEWVENEGKVLIESLNAVFKETRCVIDLESEADTIICTCGHQCINHANISNDLRRCPLCRSPITAFVRADGIVV